VFVIVMLMLAIALFIYSNSKRVYKAAILPLKNESSDPNLDYISDGIAEGVIRKLSGSGQLQMRPFTMVSGYRESGSDQATLGRELKADLIFSGKILNRDQRLIVQTSLFDSTRGIEVGSWE